MTAEAKVQKDSGQTEWKRLRKENHFLDCEVLNVTAAHILQMHLVRTSKKVEPTEPAETVKGIAPPPARTQVAQRRNWTTNW